MNSPQFWQVEVPLQRGEDPSGKEEPEAEHVLVRSPADHDPHRGNHGTGEPRDKLKARSISLRYIRDQLH